MTLSKAERKELLDLFSDLRVADVRDGMDWMMQHHQGSMWPSIRPLWRTRAVGIARTARYLPYKGTIRPRNPLKLCKYPASSLFCRASAGVLAVSSPPVINRDFTGRSFAPPLGVQPTRPGAHK